MELLHHDGVRRVRDGDEQDRPVDAHGKDPVLAGEIRRNELDRLRRDCEFLQDDRGKVVDAGERFRDVSFGEIAQGDEGSRERDCVRALVTSCLQELLHGDHPLPQQQLAEPPHRFRYSRDPASHVSARSNSVIVGGIP
jgi:hypothetical protein